MNVNETTSEVLNDLIRINNDRVTGYERAAKETASEDADLRAIFTQMATESRKYVNELTTYVARTGEEPASGTTVSGKIYRAWMNVKSHIYRKEQKSYSGFL